MNADWTVYQSISYFFTGDVQCIIYGSIQLKGFLFYQIFYHSQHCQFPLTLPLLLPASQPRPPCYLTQLTWTLSCSSSAVSQFKGSSGSLVHCWLLFAFMTDFPAFFLGPTSQIWPCRVSSVSFPIPGCLFLARLSYRSLQPELRCGSFPPRLWLFLPPRSPDLLQSFCLLDWISH